MLPSTRTQIRLSPNMIANWHRCTVSVLLALMLALGVLTGPAHAGESRVSPQLQAASMAAPDALQRVIVQRSGGDTRADAAVLQAGGRITSDLGALDAFVAFVPGHAVRTLGIHPAVKFISLDAPVYTLAKRFDRKALATHFPTTVQAEYAWNKRLTGKGVGVAIIDTGINKDLRDFHDITNGYSRLITRQAFTSFNISRLDKYGHGTHIAGIIAGNSCNREEVSVRCKYMGTLIAS